MCMPSLPVRCTDEEGKPEERTWVGGGGGGGGEFRDVYRWVKPRTKCLKIT